MTAALLAGGCSAVEMASPLQARDQEIALSGSPSDDASVTEPMPTEVKMLIEDQEHQILPEQKSNDKHWLFPWLCACFYGEREEESTSQIREKIQDIEAQALSAPQDVSPQSYKQLLSRAGDGSADDIRVRALEAIGRVLTKAFQAAEQKASCELPSDIQSQFSDALIRACESRE